MMRKLALGVLLCVCVSAVAEEMDDVLKKSNRVSEQQLDETAEKLITEDVVIKTPSQAVKAAVETQSPSKALSEDQIPVLKSERSQTAHPSSPWFRMIGGAVFVLMLSAGLLVFAKKAAKRRNLGGKKAKIEILHQHFLGPKKSLALIQVAGEAILIGVTDHNISMIKPVALIDDEVSGQAQDFHGFLDDEFTVEHLTAQTSRTRIV